MQTQPSETQLVIAPLEFVKCDLCGSIRQELKFRKISRFRGVTFSICSCWKCGLVFVNPRLPEVLLGEVYSDAYYDGVGIDKNFVGENLEKQRDANLLIRSVEKIMPSKPLRILDVGGGTGLVSHAAVQRGHLVEFSDLSAPAVERARKKGLSAHLATPDDLVDRFGEQFDVVVALEVIEHVYSPTKFLASVNRLLRPGGLFVFTTGNVSATRWEGARWGYFNIPEAHLYYFSSQTMDRYLANAGFTRRVSAYKYFYKRWWGLRLLEKLKLVDLNKECEARGLLRRSLIRTFEWIDLLAGRHRFAWAVK